MARAKTVFVCSQCGYESAKWLGRCPDCGSWNSFAEEIKKEASPAGGKMNKSQGISTQNKPRPVSQIQSSERERFDTGIGELNRVLGGGLVRGSLTLISGDPGIGKSTLLLQCAGAIAARFGTVLYVSGEESEEQIKMRADRLGVNTQGLYLVSETRMDLVEQHIRSLSPVFCIIDSIQTLFSDGLTSAPGSVSQVRECASELMRLGKTSGISLFIVAHVTKTGALAGPRVLEHMVDTVLSFEGERSEDLRILRTLKNRFGTTSEIGVFEMQETGLTQVEDASRLFLEEEDGGEGSMVIGLMEGTRPLLVQVQSLVAETHVVMPRRTAVGLEVPRLNMLLAVLEKKLSIPFYSSDVYVNVVGGLSVQGTSGDLGLALSLISSAKAKPLGLSRTLAIGEVGLTGEIRPVARAERLIQEAAKLGFQNAIVSSRQTLRKVPRSIQVHRFATMAEAYRAFFPKRAPKNKATEALDD
ncbi:DNA repair protein RadA [Clostridiaceae bacterium JG1575]|nr:DNA repair protein RadA [Clostridiaceae bacterium JG1575]